MNPRLIGRDDSVVRDRVRWRTFVLVALNRVCFSFCVRLFVCFFTFRIAYKRHFRIGKGTFAMYRVRFSWSDMWAGYSLTPSVNHYGDFSHDTLPLPVQSRALLSRRFMIPSWFVVVSVRTVTANVDIAMSIPPSLFRVLWITCAKWMHMEMCSFIFKVY